MSQEDLSLLVIANMTSLSQEIKLLAGTMERNREKNDTDHDNIGARLAEITLWQGKHDALKQRDIDECLRAKEHIKFGWWLVMALLALATPIAFEVIKGWK